MTRLPAIVFASAALLCCAGYAASAPAQTWKPDRSVELVVFAAAGGGNDKAARVIQKIWQDNRMLEAVVVNKVGGGGSLAYAYVSQKTGDAHAIAIAQAGLQTPEWKKFVDSTGWEPGYKNSQETMAYLRKEYDEARAILTDLGLAKQ